MRWAEMAAFTAVMRTHEGNRPRDNIQLDSAPEILSHFARMVRLFVALAPYRRSLIEEARAHGLPLQRPLFLHYPADPLALAADGTFLLGPDMLVAPVLRPGARELACGSARRRRMGPPVDRAHLRRRPGSDGRRAAGTTPGLFPSRRAVSRAFSEFSRHPGLMRILHALDHSLPLQSGYVYRSLGILSAERGFGWDTVQVTGPGQNDHPGPWEEADGWRFHRTRRLPRPLRVPGLRTVAEMRALRRRLLQVMAHQPPDVVHAHSPVQIGWPALHAARRARIPFVYQIRGLWEDAAVDLGHGRHGDLRHRATGRMETALMHRADAVVTLCEGMRGHLVTRGIPDEKITVVPNAVDPAMLREAQPKDQALLARLGLTGRFVLGFVGSFHPYEGLDLLFEALPVIRTARPDTAVLLVGGGPAEAAWRDAAEAHGVTPHIRFAGRVPYHDVPRYADLIDLIVLPRRRMRLTELVTPLKPLEAMAMGRLLVASDVGGHRELIRDGHTGFLFSADDADALAHRVIAVANATERHAATRAAARRFIETERTWPTTVAHLAPVYNRLTQAASRLTALSLRGSRSEPRQSRGAVALTIT